MNILSPFYHIKSLFSPRISPLITVSIDEVALLHNLSEYRQAYPDIQFAPVLKSNAYGHGLIPIARILDRENIPFLIVDSYYEALTLRQNAIKSPILIIGYISPEIIKKSRLKNIYFTVTSLAQLQSINDIIRHPISIHLKIDTGMHRQGLLPSEIHQAITIIKKSSLLQLQGICSHLADADSKRHKYNKAQLQQWEQSIQFFKTAFADLTYYHISASAGLIHTAKSHHNLARLGLGLYGISTIENTKLSLKPVLKLTSIISGIKFIKKGDTVGYNNTFIAKNDMLIATIPTGYAEGVDRRLSNSGQVEIDGILCPIIGRVSMNITTIDITHIPNIQIGDIVTLISNDHSSPISANAIAKMCDTIPYEILIHIPAYLRREIFKAK
jgi:alanine racemase